MTNQVEQKRLQRALEIVRNGGVTANAEAKSYTVKSQSGNWEYIVNTLVTGRRCGCKDRQNGHVCKHIIAAELLQAKRIAEAIVEKVQERTYSSTLVFQMNHIIIRIQGHNDLGQEVRLDGKVGFLKSQAHPWRREFGTWFDAMALLLQDKIEAEPEPEIKPIEVQKTASWADDFLSKLNTRVERNKQSRPPMKAKSTQELISELCDL